MKKMLTLGMAFAMLAAACAAYAYPTLAGPTGLVNAPDAEVVKGCTFDLALDYYNTSDNGVTTKNSYPFRALYGINGNFEVGAAYDPNAVGGKAFWDINAKYKTPLNYWGADIALGALYGQSGSSDFLGGEKLKTTDIYLAATKGFTMGESTAIAGTIGINWTNQDVVESNSGFRFYLGANAVVAKNLAIVADYQTTTSDLNENNVWGAALRYGFSPALAAEIGVSNGPLFGADDSNWFIGVDYGFGTGAAAE